MSLIMIFMVILVMLSPIVCLSTSSWLIYWVGMELGLMSLFPIMFNANSLLVSEASMKYFLVQAMASILMFFGGCFIFMLMYKNSYSFMLMSLSVVIKLGMFPFHYWVIPVIGGIWYPPMILILIPVKIPSFVLISYISAGKLQMMLFMFSIMSMLVGALLGNNCSNIRMMMGASSISHSGWVVMSSLIGEMWFYYTVYSIILFFTLLLIWFKSNLLSSLMILSLSGLPPFLLFSAKFYIMMMMIQNNYLLFTLLIPVLSALISLNFYLKSGYSFYFNSKKTTKSYYFLSVVTLNLVGSFLLFYLV
uniref:NADH dehydrogenase subunit 2 n=1 Tax=Ambigolimax valentianus TaxID=1338344 RepID=UPI002411784F|nr:NADH dehydrogenase subunit 2 [Ambigolimax valentianus]WEI33085.1 NADH dehydrogenase subunit 2 [Ambigolimax valentianus]